MSLFAASSEYERFDAREIPCAQKFARIMARWHALKPGEAFVLVNSHDPLPLFYQFNTQYAGEFEWRYEKRGPEVFEILIGRLPEESEQAEAVVGAVNPAVAGGSEPGVDVDARGLEPPEPMVRILERVKSLQTGGQIIALTDRMPVHLVQELHSRGLDCRSEERPDKSWVTIIRER